MANYAAVISPQGSTTTTNHSIFFPSPAEQALSNPLIIEKILEKVPNRDFEAKTFRLISKPWNDVILSLLSPKLVLVLNNDKSPHFAAFASTMTPELARYLCMIYKEGIHPSRWELDPPAPLDNVCTAFKNLVHSAQNFGDVIHTIKIGHGSDLDANFVPFLHKLVQDHCPNLASFSMTVNGTLTKKLEEEVDLNTLLNTDWRLNPQMIQIPIKQKLKEISIRTWLDSNNSTLGVSHLAIFCQQLVESAPNLELLEIDVNIFLDLGGVKNLTSLTLHGDISQENYFSEVQSKLHGLSRMLSQVASTLKHLNFDILHKCGYSIDPVECDCSVRLDFKMPKMLRLTSFTCDSMELFFPQGYTESLQDAVGNNLTHLEISVHGGHDLQTDTVQDWIKSVCENKGFLQTGLKSFVIGGVKDFRALNQLKGPFPSLESLKVSDYWTEGLNQDGDDDEEFQLTCALQLCSDLDLKNFSLTLKLPTKFSAFVQCLSDHSHLFRSQKMKTLHINGIKRPIDCSKIGEMDISSLEKVLMSMKAMEKVAFSHVMDGMQKENRLKLGVFIKDNNLPVEILHWK